MSDVVLKKVSDVPVVSYDRAVQIIGDCLRWIKYDNDDLKSVFVDALHLDKKELEAFGYGSFAEDWFGDKSIVVESWEDMKKKYPMDRETMDIATEKEFVEDCFKLYEKEGFSPFFWTMFKTDKALIGQPIEVVGRCTTKDCDLETLPMWKIKFPDGKETEAFPDEIIPSEMRANGCNLFDEKEDVPGLDDVISSCQELSKNGIKDGFNEQDLDNEICKHTKER